MKYSNTKTYRIISAIVLFAFVATGTVPYRHCEPRSGEAISEIASSLSLLAMTELAPPNATDPDDSPALHEQAKDQFRGKYHLDEGRVLAVWPGLAQPIIGTPRQVMRRLAQAFKIESVKEALRAENIKPDPREGLPELKPNHTPLIIPRIEELYVGDPVENIKKIRETYALPSERRSPRKAAAFGKGNNKVKFFKEIVKTSRRWYIRWSFETTDANIRRIARACGFLLKRDVPVLGDDEIGCYGLSLDEVYLKGGSIGPDRIKEAFKLPDIGEIKKNEITRCDKDGNEVTFFKRRRWKWAGWAYKATDKEQVGKSSGLESRPNTDLKIEELNLADAIAGLGLDSAYLRRFIALAHPELLPEERERLIVKALRNLGAELPPDEKEPHADYRRNLGAPKIEDPPKTTSKNSFILRGVVKEGIPFVQLAGNYNCEIPVRGDGTFTATIPLPRTGELNKFELYAFDPKAKRRSREVLSFEITQTGKRVDVEEAFRALVSLNKELLEGIEKDAVRHKLYLNCLELSFLRSFTYKESEGFKHLRQMIKDEKSPARKRDLQAVLRKFRRIHKMELPLRPGEKLYFFEKYCIDEVRSLMEKGEKGHIIANEQGLGKTLTAFMIIGDRRALILTPNSVVTTWAEQNRKFMPTPNLEVLEGAYPERDEALRARDEAYKRGTSQAEAVRPWVVVNIEFTRDMSDEKLEFLSRQAGMLVVDEADYLMSRSAKQAIGTRQIKAGFKLLLTATPIKGGSVQQLVYILGFLYPDKAEFKSANAFVRVYPINSPDPTKRRKAYQALRLLMQQKTTRLRKKDVFEEYDPSIPLWRQRDRLPKKIEVPPEELGRYELSMTQCRSILELLTDYQAWCRKHKRHKERHTREDKKYKRYSRGYFSIREAWRQIMNNPSYIGSNEDSPKHQAVDKIVQKELDGKENKGRKMLIICRYVDEVEAYAERYKNYGARVYYGQVKGKGRARYKVGDDGKLLYYKVDEYGAFVLGEDGRPIPSDKEGGRPMRALDYERICFQNAPEDRIIIMDEAGAFGIDLTAADVVVRSDLGRNYEQQYHADNRAHRISNEHKKYDVKYYTLQAVYPERFLRELQRKEASGRLRKDTLKEYFSMGTYEHVHFEDLKGQAARFHRILDGVGDPDELEEFSDHFKRKVMPFLFEKDKEEGMDEEPAEDAEDDEDSGNGGGETEEGFILEVDEDGTSPKLDARRKPRRSALAPGSRFTDSDSASTPGVEGIARMR